MIFLRCRSSCIFLPLMGILSKFLNKKFLLRKNYLLNAANFEEWVLNSSLEEIIMTLMEKGVLKNELKCTFCYNYCRFTKFD